MPTPLIPQSMADMVTKDQLLSMSGLAFMEGVRDGKLASAPIAQTVNAFCDEVELGRVTFRGSPTFDHLNPMGGVHGGWYGTLLDSALGCAVMTHVPQGSVYTTLEYKVNITRALPVGTEVIAEGVTSHVGRSTAVAEATIRGAEDGKLYATASTTCIIMKLA
ncbi:MAG: PaaI family thioesterase [Pseudomonadota bacterium]